MKKINITKKITKKNLPIFALLLMCSCAFADVTPYYINSLKRYGIGFTKIKSPLVMKIEPKKDSRILETLNFDFNDNASCQINKTKCEFDDIFAQYSKEKKLAFLTTIDSTEGWNLVCFNQLQAPVCGWVEDSENKHYNYIEFFNEFGKKYGVFLFKDVYKTDKILYAAPLKETNTTGSIELPKYIAPWLIRGNWMLVKVSDFNNKAKTGWIKYRGNDNKLRMFVKF